MVDSSDVFKWPGKQWFDQDFLNGAGEDAEKAEGLKLPTSLGRLNSISKWMDDDI